MTERKIVDYKTLQQIGFGNFGTIYLAEDILENQFAVKVINKQVIKTIKQARQIMREKEIMEILSEAGSIFVPKFLGTY